MEATAVIPRQYEPRVAKRIYVFMNGQDNERPRMLVINERRIKDFSTLLNRVTSGIRAPIAVRNLYTPNKGSRVSTLDSLENGKHYVAGGNEHFKKLRYSRYSQLHATRLQAHSKDANKASPIRPSIQVVSRFLNLPEKPYFIHVFRNGDISYQGARVLLSRRIMGSLEHVLELITEKVELTLPAKRLCTLDGQTIHSVTDIRDGEQYVAVQGSKKFIRLPYTAINPSNKSIRYSRPKRLTQHSMSITEGNALGNTFTLPPTIPEKPTQIKRLMPPKQHKGKDRPFAGRKDMEARNIALRDARADSAFGENVALKAKHPIPKQSTPVNDDSIEEAAPSPKEAKQQHQLEPSSKKGSKPPSRQQPPTPQSKEGKSTPNDVKTGGNNEEVPETEDIIIEKPIDQEEATEVAEESTAATEEHPSSNTPPALVQSQDTTAVELQGAATQQSIDLSVARVSGPGTEQNTPKTSTTNLTQTNNDNAEPEPDNTS